MYDGFVRTGGDDLWDRLRIAHVRFADLAVSVDPAGPAENSTWNARQVVAHVLTVLHRYTERDFTSADGLSADPAGVATMNEAELAALDGVKIADLLDRIAAELDRVEQIFPRDTDLTRRYPFHGGITLDGAAAIANLMGEFLLHGRDVARGAGRSWPLDAQDAALVLNVGVQVGPAFVAPDAPGDLSVQLRTPRTRPWTIAVRDGVATSEASVPGAPVDVRMYGRPQAFLLNLYGRVGIPGATLLGSTIIGGRRPWRVTRLPRTFLKP